MAKEMPLLAELSNCLSAYKETFERILECIDNACDTNHKKHDSPVILQVQDLLSIDAELKRHLMRMDEWKERQNKIEDLEKTLATLSNRVNEFAKNLSSAQTALQGCLVTAQKVQRSAAHQELPTVEQILDGSRNSSRAASGAPQHPGEISWYPDVDVIKKSSIFKKTLQISAPTIPSKQVNTNLELTRNIEVDDIVDSSEESGEEDDE